MVFESSPVGVRRHSFLQIIQAALILLGSLCAFAQSQPSTIPSTLFGMHVQSTNTSHWPTQNVGELGKGVGTAWIYVQPQQGTYDWSMLDSWVSIAQSHNIQVFWSNSGVPPWAAADPSTCHPSYSGSSVQKCTSMVSNIQYWNDFITAMATRYKGKGLIYELWNEPDTTAFTGTVQQMAQLATSAYNIIRSIDPSATIVTPSCDPPYMDQLFANGLPTGIDVISRHSYDTNPENIASEMDAMRTIMAKRGLSAKPLWNTEGSWGSATLSSDDQVGFLARYYLLMWSHATSRFYWYQWDNSGEGTLWDPTSGTHPAGVAFGQLQNWLVGATMTQPCALQSGSTWTCTITRSNYQGMIVWNTSGNTAYAPPSQYTQYRDLAGGKYGVSGSVTVGHRPILLESTTTSAATPVAVLTVTSLSGTASVTVTADSSGSYETGGTIASRTIAFGDGATATTTTATHTYNAAGNYAVTVTITDAAGRTATATKAVTVTSTTPTLTPVAVLNVTPQSGSAPLTVNIDSTGSYETGGSIVSRTISYGDGGSTTGATATHIYNNAGSYPVSLTVKDAAGKSATATKTVTVSTPTAAGGSVTITAPVASSTVQWMVHFAGSATSPAGRTISSMQLLVDGISQYTTSGATLSTWQTTAPGTHSMTIKATDSAGAVYQSSESFIVAPGLIIWIPGNYASVASPVHFSASAMAPSGRAISAIRIYVDNISKDTAYASKIDTYVSLATGTHAVAIQAWDNTGAVYKSSITITVK